MYFTSTNDMVKNIAMKIATKLSISQFNASKGWLHAFKNRNQISSKAIVGEEELVDKSKIILFKDLLTEKLLKYDPKCF